MDSNEDKKFYALSISLREKIQGLLVSISLILTAWSFGGYHNSPLHSFLLLSLLSLFVLLAPQAWFKEPEGTTPTWRHTVRRFIKLPFFWFSLCFLAYIILQIFNPSAQQVYGENSWWIEAIRAPLGSDWPSSVQSQYGEMNALRALVTHSSALLLAAGIFVGIRRRAVILFALWTFMISATTMGFTAILQELSGTQKILWSYESSNLNFWGTFIYRNQGAAFLMLNMLVSGALYFFYSRHRSHIFRSGGPHFICFLCVFLSLASIWLSLSRGGMVLASILTAAFISLIFIYSFQQASISKWLIKLAVSLSILLLGAFFVLQFTNFKQLDARFSELTQVESNFGTDSRMLASKATLDMAKDRLKFGWGAGSFRYVFPIYQSNYESIWYHYYNKKKGWMGRKFYEYAHNDWAQFLAEYGVVGCVPLGLLFFYLLYQSLLKIKRFPFLVVFLLLGLFLIFLHNLFDFIFSSPSYWIAFWSLIALILRLLHLESKATSNNT